MVRPRDTDQWREIIILKLENPDRGYREIADKVGTSISQVCRVWNWYLEQRAHDPEIKAIDRREEMSDEDLEKFADQVAGLAQNIQDARDFQRETMLSVPGEDPVMVVFWGDLHYGAVGTDYERLKADVEELSALKRSVIVGMGDYKDNANPLVHKDSTHESAVPPWIQDMIIKKMIREVNPKVLIRGCHDHWDYQTGTRDFVKNLCRECKPRAVNLWHGGLVNVHIGGEVYKIRARHKFRRESSLNTTNVQRALADEKGPVDVIAVAHKHFPDLQKVWKFEREIIYLRSGSYKQDDEFAQRAGAWSGVYGVPAVVLMPDEHRVVPFWDFREALVYLEGLKVVA